MVRLLPTVPRCDGQLKLSQEYTQHSVHSIHGMFPTAPRCDHQLNQVQVVFCHVIAIYSSDYLDLLAAFVDSLKPLPDDNSEGIEKLYRLCLVFHQVARLYVEAKAQEARTQAQSQANLTAGAAFDPYLSMLGFAPNQAQYLAPEWPQTTDIAADWPKGTDLSANDNIQDWFSGNSNIMSLLDQDIDYLNAGMNVNKSNYQQ